MKTYLRKTRKPETNIPLSPKIICSVFILLLGTGLGIFSKWLDNLAISDSIWWNHILEILDLGNVFSSLAIWLLIALAIAVYSKTPVRAGLNVFLFFAGMCISYHLYTIVFSGFDPQNYMKLWYGLTLCSPLAAFICWYGKGKTALSLAIDIAVLGGMILACFSIGFWYFDLNNIINVFIFVCSVIVLYSVPQQILVGLLGGVLLAFGIRLVI